MGITKKPTCDCHEDELVMGNIFEHMDNIEDPEFMISDNDSDEDYISEQHSEFIRYIFPNFNFPPDLLEPPSLPEIDIESLMKPPVKIKHVTGMGRRKTNRAQNEKFLLSLGDTEQDNPKDEIFFNENKYGFSKVMNLLCAKPEVKNMFIEGNEDLLLKKNKKGSATKSTQKNMKRNIFPDIAFQNLTASQKSLFKQKSLPLTVINQLESEVVQYFTQTPNGIYRSKPLSNYHRILLHSIVRYYSLDAKSVNGRGHRAQKIVQIRNTFYNDFQPPWISLFKYVIRMNA